MFHSSRLAVGILVSVLVFSLVFNLNGDFWLSQLHSYQQLIALIVTGSCLLMLRFSGSWHLTRLDAALLGLFIFLLGSRAWTLGVLGASASFDYLTLTTLALLIYYLVVRRIRWTRRTQRRYYAAVSLVGLCLCLYGLLEWSAVVEPSNINWPLTGNFSNPGPFGGFLAVVACFSWLVARAYYQELRYYWALVHSTIGIGLMGMTGLTQSRAAVLALAATGIYYSFSGHRKSKLFAGGFTVVAVVVLLLLPKSSDSLLGRLLIWKVALRSVAATPIIGTGPGTFPVTYLSHQAQYFSHQSRSDEVRLADATYHAFNETLEFGCENGLVGLLLLLLVAATLVQGYWSNLDQRQRNIALMPPLIAVGIFAQFSYPFSFLCFKLLLLTQLALISSTVSPVCGRINGTLAAGGTLLLLGMLGTASAKLYLAVIDWQAAEAGQNESPDQTELVFQRANRYLYSNGHFLYAYAVYRHDRESAQAVRHLEQASQFHTSVSLCTRLGHTYEQLGKYPQAETAFQTAHFMVPQQLQSQATLICFYIRRHDWPNAIYWREHLLNTPVKIHSYEAQLLKMRARNPNWIQLLQHTSQP